VGEAKKKYQVSTSVLRIAFKAGGEIFFFQSRHGNLFRWFYLHNHFPSQNDGFSALICESKNSIKNRIKFVSNSGEKTDLEVFV
jgi:hypothetical protein